jgi:hypothetical protein
MMIDFSGSASQVEAAFSLGLRYYLVNGELRLGSADDPTIPSPLASVIQSVRGVYTIQDREAYGLKLVDIPVGAADSPQPDATFCKNGTCTNYMFPADFATIYDLNPVYSDSIDGTGQTSGDSILCCRSRRESPPQAAGNTRRWWFVPT